jgi:multidrug transporter EmrE-like cation transporter
VRILRRAPKHEHVSPLDVDYEPPLPPGEKRRTIVIVVFILTSVAMAAVGQLILKYGVDQIVKHTEGVVLRDPIATAVRVARTPAVWGGLALFGLSAAMWIVVLSRTSLSFAYPFASLTYVLILLFDRFVLDEPVSGLRYGGVALIISGLVLISRTGQP